MQTKVDRLGKTVPGFVTSTYSSSSFRFRWIHLPANCIQWMTDAATITYQEKERKKDEIIKTLQFLGNSWHELPESELPESRSEGKYMYPNCSRSKFYMGGNMQRTDGMEAPGQLALYIPYIKCAPPPHNDQDRRHDGDQNEHDKGIQRKDDEANQGSSGKLRAEIDAEDQKLPFHESQTLDTYHHGREAAQRDCDQVLSRYVRRRLGELHPNLSRKELEAECLNSGILHVGQLWLWVVDDRTVITGTSHHPRVGIDSQAGTDPIFERILNRLSDSDKSVNREAILDSIHSFVKFILSFYVNIIDNLTLDIRVTKSDEKSKRHTNPKFDSASVHMIYANSIEDVNTTESELRQSFRDRIGDTSGGIATEETHKIHTAVAKATEALTEIKDIRGELNMIRSVVQTQQRVWDQLFGQPAGYDERVDSTQYRISWKSTDPDYVLGRIQTLLEFAQETEKSVESVLGLRMNQLSLNEAEIARIQGRTVMVFTVVTVIFAPISFLTSLFALNISIFPHSGGNVLYQPKWIFAILFGTLAVFSLLVWIAVKISEPQALPSLIKVIKKLSWKHARLNGMNDTKGIRQEVQGPELLAKSQRAWPRYLPPGLVSPFLKWRGSRASQDEGTLL
ncbi:hypothetical protein GGR51DRAFT_530171 [Nemania sp. FL0031]|nr:hypothetical protein GGR51DRAFT_530171 [Nemania sp. FL0031]